MKKTAVIYWSGTGNTKAMAEAVLEGMKEAGADAALLEPGDVNGSTLSKPVGLFGSYGWGDGEWMRSWEKNCDDAGVSLACDSIICQEAPDDDTLASCRAMGKTLAE